MIAEDKNATNCGAEFSGGLGRCGSCRWWEYLDGEEVGGKWKGSGLCFRFPPTSPPTSEFHEHAEPRTMSWQGCGEWKPGYNYEKMFNGEQANHDWPYSEELGCFWCGWQVQEPGVLTLMVPPMSYPDMSACIRLALRLMPEAHRINCSGAEDPTHYELRDGVWRSMRRPCACQRLGALRDD